MSAKKKARISEAEIKANYTEARRVSNSMELIGNIAEWDIGIAKDAMESYSEQELRRQLRNK